MLNQQVAFNIGGQTVTAKPADIGGWVDLTPVEKDKTVDVTVDSGRVLEYIDKIAKPYVQPPRSKIVMNTDSGQVVLDKGADGMDVYAKDKTASDVAGQLLNNKGVKVELSVKYAAAKTVEAQTYSKWLIADTTTKRMYAYEQSTLVKHSNFCRRTTNTYGYR